MEFKKFSSLENTYNQKLIDKVVYEGKNIGRWIVTEKLHGCFDGKTPVTLPDGSFKTIKEIVDSKYSGEVLGVDADGNLVPTNVVNWYENGETSDWLKVTFQTYGGKGGRVRTITCTPDHKFFSNGVYTPIGLLGVGDTVECTYSGLSLNFIQKQILIGKMLGDGSLTFSAVCFGHKKDKEEYVDFTLKCLGSFAGKKQKDTVSGHGTVMARARSVSSSSVDELFAAWDKKSGYIPELILTPISLAFWYMDDGSISLTDAQRPRASFATCGFSSISCENLKKSLAKLGIDGNVSGEPGRLRVTLSADSTEVLFSYICPFIPECMQYKIPPEFRVASAGDGFMAYAESEKSNRKSHAVIKKIEKVQKTSMRYDIETGTHNYFANNIHVHNCNFSFWCDGNEVKVASRTQFVDGTFFNCQAVINKHEQGILDWHKQNLSSGDELIVYGELYGANIQKEVVYGKRRFSAFDIRINGAVQDKLVAIRMSAEMGLEFVPILHFGTFEECMNVPHEFRSKETPQDFPEDKENFAEGLVIEPIEPAWFNNGSRIYFKNKTPAFTEKKARQHKTPTPSLPEDALELLNSVLEYCTEARVRNVISKIGEVTNKDFGRVGGLLVQDMIEDFEKDTEISLKKEAEDHWKQFAGALSREAIAVARPVILESME